MLNVPLKMFVNFQVDSDWQQWELFVGDKLQTLLQLQFDVFL